MPRFPGRQWWRRRSPPPPGIRVRLTLFVVLCTAILAGALCTVMVLLFHQRALDAAEQALDQQGRRVLAQAATGTLPGGLIYTGGRELVQVIGPDGGVYAASAPMLGYPPVPSGPDAAVIERDIRRDGRSCRVRAPGDGCHLVTEYRTQTVGGPVTVYALARVPDLLPDPALAALLLLGVPLLAGLAGAGTCLTAGRALRPVERIRAELDEITATDLERRVPVPPQHDEIRRLADSVNATLDRLEAAVAKQRGFVSDVSHELRTPLTGLRMELELALADPEADDLRETLAATLRNADRLQAVLEDLFALVRLDTHQMGSEPVDLHELTDTEVLRRPRRSRVRVEADGPVVVHGGRAELARLLTNLIDNADRHAESTVSIRLSTEPGEVVVEVVDDGPGIAPEDRGRVFERFTRLAEGRHHDAGSTGLGLAISRDIAAAHGGSLILTDRLDGERGARFVLRLPE
ncbi:sensor histidine kinase [Actinomadura macrotermitis]|uniref:histidine kinase n=1 Tax=Actinomadura macrotermitis TaxID=2585200 RepID=A0A7K0BS00_9ACTN|nr:Adaptive-response sensory-kinase SasA [Actinomadura macrotermitis]